MVAAVKLDEAVVYAVSPDRVAKRTFLIDLAGFTGESLLEVESTNHVAALFLSILDEFRQRYPVTYAPRASQKPAGTIWRSAPVRVICAALPANNC